MQFGVSESVAHWGRYRPDATAVFQDGTLTTYAELNRKVNILCKILTAGDFRSSRVAVAVRSKLEALTSFIAILRICKSVVPLNLGLKTEAIRTNLKQTQVVQLIHDSGHTAYRPLLPGKSVAINIDEVDWSSNNACFEPTAFSRAEDEWGVLFSSGTTGVPKGIERSQYSIITELIGWCIELELGRSVCFYVGRPVFYTGGLLLTMATLLVGGSIVLNDYPDDNDAVSVWKDYQGFCENQRPTWAFFVPDQIRRFTTIASEASANPRGAKTILTMGAGIKGSEKLAAAEVLGCEVVESWGNSESLGTITEPTDLTIRPESIGRPFLTDELCIVDDDGNPLPPGQRGRLAGGTEAGFERYSKLPDETRRVKRGQRIISDDIGYVDPAGYFYVCGRAQECVLVGGESVFIPDIESKLRSLPYIDDCAVIALSNEHSGAAEFVGVLVTETASCLGDAELLKKVNEALLPRERLVRIKRTEALPQVASGKTDKAACKGLAADS